MNPFVREGASLTKLPVLMAEGLVPVHLLNGGVVWFY